MVPEEGRPCHQRFNKKGRESARERERACASCSGACKIEQTRLASQCVSDIKKEYQALLYCVLISKNIAP